MRLRRFAQFMWTRAGILVVVIIAVPLITFLTYKHSQHLAQAEAKRAMKQAFAALELYAEASDGNYFPLRSAQPGVFLPDMDEWAKLGDGNAQFEQASDALTGDGGRPLCYLGYGFHDNNEALAHGLLDKLEKNPEGLRGGGPVLPEEPWITDPSSPEVDKPHPLRKGVERCFVWEYVFHGMPPSADDLKLYIPILWQMPRQVGDRVLVLHLNGLISWHKYPGPFPMSPLFINRLRGLMGLPQDPGFTLDSPILPVVRGILDAGSREPGRSAGSLLHFEAEPSVSFRNVMGYRMEFTCSEMILYPEQPEARSIPMDALFGPPRYECFGLPLPTVQYMGSGMGYHWYGKTRYDEFLLVRDKLGLSGGDSLYPAAAEHCLRSEPTWVWLPESSRDKRKPAEIRQNPDSLADYVGAYIAVRKQSGRPVSGETICAAAILCGSQREGYGAFAHPTLEIILEAKNRLIAAAQRDPEAASTLVLPYVLRYRVRSPRSEATPEMVELLQKLPSDAVIPIVQHLATNLQNLHEAALCQQLLKRLQKSPTAP